jgi:hypothetical protein
VSKEKRKIWPLVALLLFLAYFFLAARPIPKETILLARWISPLESGQPVFGGGAEEAGEGLKAAFAVMPFTLAGRFGYVDVNGRFSVNNEKQGYLSLSQTKWALYGAEPASLEIRDYFNNTVETIDKPRGYPAFLDGRTFIFGSDQNALSETDGFGNILWAYESAAPLTCADAAAGLVLAGSLDGVVEVLDSGGRQIFVFEPGGSRYSIILGCAFSRDGSQIALVSGIEPQRFLLLERYGNNEGYKVIYHEFLESGFRRPVHIGFIDQGYQVVFEREGGLGIHEVGSRKSYKVALDGTALAIDNLGEEGRLFVITDSGKGQSADQKNLVGINLPQKVFIRAPFKSTDAFLGRSGSQLFLGGGSTLASYELEKK